MSAVVFIILHFLAALLLWLIGKALFLAYNARSSLGASPEIPPARVYIYKVYRHGLRSDIVAACYLTAIPLLVLMIGVSLGIAPSVLAVVLAALDLLLALVAALIIVSDTALYRFWQSKLDRSVFAYLRSLKGVFASVSTTYVVVALLALLLTWLCAAVLLLLPLEILSSPSALSKGEGALCGECSLAILYAVVFLLLAALLFVGLRGLGIRPLNPSIAYFSKIPFFNHAALNPMHSLVYSLGVKNEYRGKFRAMPDEECEAILKELGMGIRRLGQSDETDLRGMCAKGAPQQERAEVGGCESAPNIIVVVWESMSQRFAHVMPNVARLSHEAITFDNCVATTFRTDRGLPAILCGLPGQPTASIIRHTRKLPALPSLIKCLRADGYDTTAVHGGDCFIMHKREFYLAVGHDRVIEQRDIVAPKDQLCKWGIHDGFMFDYVAELAEQKSAEGKPFAITLQTLSSHEPFDIPASPSTVSPKGEEALCGEQSSQVASPSTPVERSFAYTDACFGEFINRLKATPLWDNLLVVVTGDHGLNDGAAIPRVEQCHIPWLILGGAVTTPQRVSTIVSQADLPATVLSLLGKPTDAFPFSRDALAPYSPGALHTYPNAFLFRDQTGYTHYDNISQQIIDSSETNTNTNIGANTDAERLRRGKALLQAIYKYIAEID